METERIVVGDFQHEIKNNLSNNESILPYKVNASVYNIIKKEGYTTYHITEKNISTGGGNYLGILYEVDINGECGEGNKETNLFIKRAITSASLEVLSVSDVYQRENFFYNEISKLYERIQDEADINMEKRFKICRSFNENNAEAIILENISRKGYSTLNRMEVVSLEFAELSLQQLGKFHALSFALEIRNPEYYENKVKTLNCLMKFDDNWKSYLNKVIDNAVSKLDYDSGRKLLSVQNSMIDKCAQFLKLDPLSKFCLCHGDYRANNILMKSKNGRIDDVIPVDYQLIYFGNPVHDFLYFVFSATDKPFRSKHLSHLKKVYHNSMVEYLELLGLNSEMIYPENQFEKDYKERLIFGLLNMLMISPFIFAPEDDVPDLSKKNIAEMEISTDDRYEERVRGIVDEFIEWGYL